MTERPIIFKAEMVNAILDGSKTQTRRIIKTFDFLGEDCIHVKDHNNKNIAPLGCTIMNQQKDVAADFCPHGKVGDILWVRENFKVTAFFGGYESGHTDDFDEAYALVEYSDGKTKLVEGLIEDTEIGLNEIAQAERAFKKKTSPSIHMPRWASRINLEITGIRVERLNDISEEDSIAEGIGGVNGELCDVTGIVAPTHKDRFKNLWESINGAGSWDENPWLWVIEFKKMGVK